MSVFAKTIASAGLIGALTISVAACSSSPKAANTPTPTPSTSSSTPVAPTSSSSAAAPAAADAATTAAVTKAYTTFFSATGSTAERAAALQNAAKLAAALAQEAKNPVAATLTATVSAVTLENPHVADVTFTLLSKGAPLLSNNPGKAVLVNGTWHVAATTFCGLVAASGPVPAPCTDASITALPSS